MFEQMTTQMLETTKKKNSDYTADNGDAFYNFKQAAELAGTTVEQGFLTRMGDKITRLKGLGFNKDLKVTDESYADTLIDLATYSLLMAIYLKDKNINEFKEEMLTASKKADITDKMVTGYIGNEPPF